MEDSNIERWNNWDGFLRGIVVEREYTNRSLSPCLNRQNQENLDYLFLEFTNVLKYIPVVVY